MSKISFRKQALGPFFILFLLRKLPLAFVAGVKLKELNDTGSTTSLKFRWVNKNPFNSIYFAAMHMAAELATGLLLFQYVDTKTRFSMLLIETKARFFKKAVGKITFSCANGEVVDTFIKEMILKQDGDSIVLPVDAFDEAGQKVAQFQYEWSCREKS